MVPIPSGNFFEKKFRFFFYLRIFFGSKFIKNHCLGTLFEITTPTYRAPYEDSPEGVTTFGFCE